MTPVPSPNKPNVKLDDPLPAPVAYKHTFSLTDTLPSFTLFKSFDAQVYQMPMSYVEKFSLKIVAEGKLMEVDASMQGQYPQKFPGTPPTPKYSTVKSFAGYAPKLSINGKETCDIDEFTLNFQQKVTPWFAICGNPDPSSFYPGERTAALDFTARFDETTLMDMFDNTQDFSLSLDVQGEAIAAGVNQQLHFEFPVVNFDSLEWDLGRDNVLVKGKATARPSDQPLLSCYVVNGVVSYDK